MKNLYSRQEFNALKVNEGLFSALFKSLSKLYNKVKGGNELQKVKDTYKAKIKAVFDGMAKAEQSKTAANKNVAGGVEQPTTSGGTESVFFSGEKVFEADTATVQNPGAQKTAQTKTQTTPATDIKNPPPAQNTEQKPVTPAQPDNPFSGLSKEQLAQVTKNAQTQITQLVTNFKNEIAALKKRFTNKDGEISKSLEYSIALAESELTDFNFEQWQNYYTQIGDKASIQRVQGERSKIAQEIKANTEKLKQTVEGKDIGKRTYEVGKQYNYKNSQGKDKIITIKELDKDGNVAIATTTNDAGEEITINPYTDKIGDKVEEKPKEEQTAQKKAVQQPAATQQTATQQTVQNK